MNNPTGYYVHISLLVLVTLLSLGIIGTIMRIQYLMKGIPIMNQNIGRLLEENLMIKSSENQNISSANKKEITS